MQLSKEARKTTAKRARKATGLSQRAFAELIDVHYTTVAHWESGDKTPSNIAISLLKLILKNPTTSIKILT